MAEIITAPNTSNKRRSVRKPLRIDMTPLVDLGFLLITFFIFTSTMAEPYATKLYMPADGTSTKLGDSGALTVLLDKDNHIYYYEGQWDVAIKMNNVKATNYDPLQGLGHVIRQKQQQLGKQREDLMLIIKPLNDASYANVINTLDEVLINGVKRYAIIDPTQQEKDFIK